MTFYAYIHAKPEAVDASGVFYVGKGFKGRYRPLPARNRYHGFVLAKYGAENILTGKLDCSSEEISFELERGLIKCLKRAGAPLTNMTDGGEGSSGYVMTDEAKAKISAASTENGRRPEIKAARSAHSTKANNERWADPVYKARVSAAMRGKKKTNSDAALQARRENAKKASSPESNALKAAASRARWADPEFKARMAAKKKAAWQNPEQRKAMLAGRSEGIKKSWTNPEVRAKRITSIRAKALQNRD